MKVQCWSQNKTTPKTQPNEKPHPFPCCLLSLSCLRFCLCFLCGPSYLKVLIRCPIFSSNKDILKNRKTVHSNELLNEKSCLKAAVKKTQHIVAYFCVFSLTVNKTSFPLALESVRPQPGKGGYGNVQLHLLSTLLINVLTSAFVEISTVISLDDQLYRAGHFQHLLFCQYNFVCVCVCTTRTEGAG